MAHDYSISVARRVFGEFIGGTAPTKIGDNCFLGMNSIIRPGTTIGNNCIVGAGSVVGGVYPDNVVIAGNPAKVICTLDEILSKKKGTVGFRCKKVRIGTLPSHWAKTNSRRNERRVLLALYAKICGKHKSSQ